MSDRWSEDGWIEAMKAKGHSPILTNDGSLDVFVCDHDYHNGPGCSICHWSCCWNCDSPADIPECDCIDGSLSVIALPGAST